MMAVQAREGEVFILLIVFIYLVILTCYWCTTVFMKFETTDNQQDSSDSEEEYLEKNENVVIDSYIERIPRQKTVKYPTVLVHQ